MIKTALTIGTRGSPLALAQAHEVRNRIASTSDLAESDIAIEVIQTSGDQILDRPLSEVGGKGLFTKEIEQALLEYRIDLAVHSSKDMATVLPDGLEISAFLPREDTRDALIGPSGIQSLNDLPERAILGSSSLRRRALALRHRPDLQIVEFRGNVQTRLRKLDDGIADATLLAIAGLRRLGQADIASAVLPSAYFPPAPGQGAICIESRVGDSKTLRYIEPLHDETTGHQLACERAFLAALDGSCRTPIAGLATVYGGHMRFSGTILTPDGKTAHDIENEGAKCDAITIGRIAGEKVRSLAGASFFDSWR